MRLLLRLLLDIGDEVRTIAGYLRLLGRKNGSCNVDKLPFFNANKQQIAEYAD